MKIKKAVILAAGFGTRMLPATKAVPKELLPVVDTPAIQMVVEEIVAAGIKDIVIVIERGQGRADATIFRLRRSSNASWPSATSAICWKSCAGPRTWRRSRRWSKPSRWASVMRCCKRKAAVGSQPFAVVLPDDIFDCQTPCLRQLIEVAETRDGPVVALLRLPHADVSKYGIVEATPMGSRLLSADRDGREAAG